MRVSGDAFEGEKRVNDQKNPVLRYAAEGNWHWNKWEKSLHCLIKLVGLASQLWQ
jgi:hypothetical protein